MILLTSVWRCTIANQQFLKLTLLEVNMLNENEFIVRRNWFAIGWFKTCVKIYPIVHTLTWNDKTHQQLEQLKYACDYNKTELSLLTGYLLKYMYFYLIRQIFNRNKLVHVLGTPAQ